MLASLDPMSAVFAEVAKGKQAINMALLPLTKKGEPGYLVERIEKVTKEGRKFNPFSDCDPSYILYLKARGRIIKVWSRKAINYCLNAGFDVESIQRSGKAVELRVYAKNPMIGREGVFEVEAALKKIEPPQMALFSDNQPEPRIPTTKDYWPTQCLFQKGEICYWEAPIYNAGEEPKALKVEVVSFDGWVPQYLGNDRPVYSVKGLHAVSPELTKDVGKTFPSEEGQLSKKAKFEAALKKIEPPQMALFSDTQPEPHIPRTAWDRRAWEREVEARAVEEEEEMEDRLAYQLAKPDKEETEDWPPIAKFKKGQKVYHPIPGSPELHVLDDAIELTVEDFQYIHGGGGVGYFCNGYCSEDKALFTEDCLFTSYEEALQSIKDQWDPWQGCKFIPGQTVACYTDRGYELGYLLEDRPDEDEHQEGDEYEVFGGDFVSDPLYYFESFKSGDTEICRESDLSADDVGDLILELEEEARGTPSVDPYVLETHDSEDEGDPEGIRIVDRSSSRLSTRWAYIDFDTNEEFTLAYALDRYNQTLPKNEGIIQLLNSQSPLRGAYTAKNKRSHKKPDNVLIYTKDGNQSCAFIEVNGSAHDGRYREDATRETIFHNDGVMAFIPVSNEEIREDPDAVVQRIVDRMDQLRRTGIKVKTDHPF